MNLIELAESDLIEIIDSRNPIGKFWAVNTAAPEMIIKDDGGYEFLEDEDCFVAVDNSNGEAWTEEFSNYNEMISWLKNE